MTLRPPTRLDRVDRVADSARKVAGAVGTVAVVVFAVVQMLHGHAPGVEYIQALRGQ